MLLGGGSTLWRSLHARWKNGERTILYIEGKASQSGGSRKRRLIEPSPFVEARRREARLLAIQSAPDSMSSVSGAVVRSAKTRAPAALPARIPAGASSMTMQSAGARPRSFAAFRYGSGSGLPRWTSVEVTKFLGSGRPAARR